MKRFLYRLLCFCIIPVATLLLLEISITLGRKKLFAESKLEKVFAGSASAYQWISDVQHSGKVLLLGSSTVKYGLSCLTLNKLSHDSLAFINLGADARDPVETYFILKSVDLAHVKAIFMGIDPWIFTKAYYRNRNNYLYLDMNARTAFNYSLEYDQQLFPIRYKNLINAALNRLPNSMMQKTKPPPDFGSGVLTANPVNFNAPVHKKFQLEQYGWSDLQFEYLQKIATFCNNNKISFTAFIPPKRADYIADYTLYCKQVDSSFYGKLIEVGFNTPIIGSIDQLKMYGDTLFADAYHLNEKGQQVYSDLFYRMIQP